MAAFRVPAKLAVPVAFKVLDAVIVVNAPVLGVVAPIVPFIGPLKTPFNVPINVAPVLPMVLACTVAAFTVLAKLAVPVAFKVLDAVIVVNAPELAIVAPIEPFIGPHIVPLILPIIVAPVLPMV